jgi:hypothetical protein
MLDKSQFNLFLKECEFRFNYGQAKQLLTTLKKWIKTTSKSPACEEIIYASPNFFSVKTLPCRELAAVPPVLLRQQKSGFIRFTLIIFRQTIVYRFCYSPYVVGMSLCIWVFCFNRLVP